MSTAYKAQILRTSNNFEVPLHIKLYAIRYAVAREKFSLVVYAKYFLESKLGHSATGTCPWDERWWCLAGGRKDYTELT